MIPPAQRNDPRHLLIKGDERELVESGETLATDAATVRPSRGVIAARGCAILAATLFTISGLLTVAGFLAGDPDRPNEAAEPDVRTPAQPAIEEEDKMVAPISNEELIGAWVQAESGGEDGRTNCADAESMTTFNGGTTETMQFYRNGIVDYTVWYDVAFENRREPEVKAAYNNGTWSLDGTKLHISWKGGNTGLFGSDLGADEVDLEITIRGNVMTQIAREGATRLVRCR